MQSEGDCAVIFTQRTSFGCINTLLKTMCCAPTAVDVVKVSGQAPASGTTPWNVNPAGRSSVRLTVPGAEPVLVTVIVNTVLLPAQMVAGFAVFAIDSESVGIGVVAWTASSSRPSRTAPVVKKANHVGGRSTLGSLI